MTIVDSPFAGAPPAPASAISLRERVRRQREFFALGYTRDPAYRVRRLQDLRRVLAEAEDAVVAALRLDLGRSPFETLATELGPCLQELDAAIAGVPRWTRPQKLPRARGWSAGPARLVPEPLGAVAILSAWYAPLLTAIGPLAGAIAGGNCASVKPSELAPQTSALLADLLARTFDPIYVAAVEGGAATSQALLDEPFDRLFFAGEVTAAKVVMAHATRHLTPTTLALAGPNLCLVDEDADLAETARNIAWAKFASAGQTGTAPDAVWVSGAIAAEFAAALGQAVAEFYGDDPRQSPDYGRIVSEAHFDRLLGLLAGERVVLGGKADRGDRYLAPTVLDGASWMVPAAQTKIFGPILPLLPFSSLDGAIARLREGPKPAMLAYFSTDRAKGERLADTAPAEVVGLGDAAWPAEASPWAIAGMGNLPGSDPARARFDGFVRHKAIARAPRRAEARRRYPPHGDKHPWLKRRRD